MENRNDRYPAVSQVFVRPDGSEIIFHPRRLARPDPSLHRHVVLAEGDRLDLLAHRGFGAADQLWRLCEASGVLDPFEVRPGLTVRVPEV